MKQVISFSLAILLLLSSTGIGYAQHFCGGLKMDAEIAFVEKSLSCGMDMETHPCDDEKTIAEGHLCCENQFTQINTDDSFAKASLDFKFDNTFVAAFVSVFVLAEVELFTTSRNIFAEYNPPPIDKDIPVLYQSFLI
ncbi:HYC_CC_PP family protein [Aequorivita echinoideorum]|uniref:Secreted protein n=1 Tax=Aequorivita echinoideorum TaxID=1549647 RepID=A0ABS5S281_9FLAO|nr:hypothetical protein [Aequorivita echinoideorum]MBT0607306.1 hypothetical protein [Aequorivita echinoideorum]